MTPIRPNVLRLLRWLGCLGLVLLPNDSWVWGEEPRTKSTSRKNVLLICIDDLRPELRCYGANHVHSPNMDSLASHSIRFARHYVHAPTCGASRYALLTGQRHRPLQERELARGPNHHNQIGRSIATGNEALFERAALMRAGQAVSASLPEWFRKHGYTTVAVGKVSHHPGGRGGADWDDPKQLEMPDSWDRQPLPAGPWLHPRGWMHGLAHGETRTSNSPMALFQAMAGEDSIYPDGLTIAEALRELDCLADAKKPFFLACGILRPHLPFGAPESYLTPYVDVVLPPIPHPHKPDGQTTWHASAEFRRYEQWGRDPNLDPEFADQVRKHYAACVSYADAQVGKLITKLKERGLWENTLVVLWGDHGWHLGEHAVWGKHTLFEESLRSPLLIRAPGDWPRNQVSHAVVETVDIFPTLCELAQLPIPEFISGQSLVPELMNPALETLETYAISYMPNAQTIRSNRFRMILHRNGHVELYDHDGEGETKNVASQLPEIVNDLTSKLEDMQRLPERNQDDH
ncbi:MAG: sulfatase [Planctomycetaceae bacterium]|nr:sulfatase [Planctomycetaceae bacterium]